MEERCACCGNEVLENDVECPYCGNRIIDSLSDDGDSIVNTLARKHRDEVLDELTDFHITTYSYKYDSDKNELGAPKKTSYSIARTGSDCFGKLIWTQGNNWIAHPQEDVSEGEAEITYKYKNQSKKLNFPIKLKALEGVWYIGLKIESNLHLSVFVGVDEKNLAGEVRNLALELH